jgi:hypothetical protein
VDRNGNAEAPLEVGTSCRLLPGKCRQVQARQIDHPYVLSGVKIPTARLHSHPFPYKERTLGTRYRCMARERLILVSMVTDTGLTTIG